MGRILRKYWQAGIVLCLLLVLSGVQASAGEPGPSITQELADLEPYVEYAAGNGIRLQIIDSSAALEDGFSRGVVILAQEMVAYQNDMARAAFETGTRDVTRLNVPLAKYPAVAEFFAQMTEQFRAGNVSSSPSALASEPHPCGNWDYPVPNYTPPWYYYSSDNPEQTLLYQDFHRTESYACEGGCQNGEGVWVDFTRGRPYTGPYGTCSDPRFRDHGRIQSSSSFGKQLGEPNSEIFSYSWPYWNWGAYCQWWHNTY